MSTPFGTTPTFTLTFTDENLDLTAASHVYVTFLSGVRKITLSDSDLTVAEKQISVVLTQEETLALIQNPASDAETTVQIQANWTYATGKRGSSEVAFFPFSKQLLAEVID